MKIKRIIRFVLLSVLLLVLPNFLQAGHLPTKSYTTFDGLANDSVNKIVRDSRGFLWFCTGEGLSRFDGFAFKNYTQNEGLPHRNINDFLESKDDDFLIATNNGLAVFNPTGAVYRWNILTSKLEQNTDAPPMFRTFLTPNPNDEAKKRAVLTLTESSDGKIFAGTLTTLFQLEKSGDEWIFHEIKSELFVENTIFASLQVDSFNYLWTLTSSGIYRISPSGVVEKIEGDGGGSVLLDKDGQIWITASGTDAGLRVFTISADGKNAQLKKTYRKPEGLPMTNSMAEIKQVSDGRILILVGDTLCEFLPNAAENESKFRVIARGAFQSLAEDGGGNLWLGTQQEGAWKISQTGFIKFDQSDGIPPEEISSIFTNSGGELFITNGKQIISRFSNGRFENVAPIGLKSRSWGNGHLDFQSANGDWWITSTEGLRFYQKPSDFAGLSNLQPTKIYTTDDGLFSNEVSNIFEDSRGDVWITTINSGATLQRREHESGKIIHFSADDNLPNSNGAVAFAEDADDSLWIGFYFGGLARYRNGKFQFFKDEDGIPVGQIRNIYADKSGRLWIATASRGVFRADNPTTENPKFTNLSTAEGLSSNQTNCVTEDNFGQIYIGSGRGVNRLNPANNNIKLYTQADGLPGSVVSLCRRDSAGALWFVSRNSLVKFLPQTENVLNAPRVFIGGISVNGTAQNISELGTETVERFNLSADQKQIKIDFFALGFGAGDRLHYQYKLGEQDWSASDELKSVTFNLEAGEYNFAVRAVNADGFSSENPATVSFTIAPPFYRRPWFLLLAALFIGGIILTVERNRAAKVKALENLAKVRGEKVRELEQVRKRIAADLHDDIGSSLTQISIFSEVLQMRVDKTNQKVLEPLEFIATSSRELVDAMSDIVWAINPNKDFLSELSGKMRRFASDVFTARNIEFTYTASPSADIALGANLRREVFLIFKESINNIVKHAACTTVQIELNIGNSEIVLRLHDNGKGFKTKHQNGGHGLVSMNARANGLGGKLEIVSGKTSGTIVKLIVPLLSEPEAVATG